MKIPFGSLRRRQIVFSVGILILCWAVLYLPHLRTSPGWYGDETLTLNASRDLAQGIPSHFAIWNTFWHPHYPYQPGYSLVNGLAANLAGGDILGSRIFNACLALCAALAIFFLGRHSFGSRASLFAALMFLAYGQSIVHFRMGNSHNAAGLGLLIMTLFLLRRAGPRNDWMAGLGLMLAAGAHPLFVNGALPAVLCRLKRPWSWVRLGLPSALYLVVSMAILYKVFGVWLVEDLEHLKNIHTARGESDGGGVQAFQNFRQFISQDWFHLGLLGGLLLCIPLRRYAAPLVGLTVLFLLVRNRQNLTLFYYQAIVILPVLCLGWAGLWRYCETRLRRERSRLRNLVFALGALPVLLISVNLPASLAGRVIPRNQYWVTQSPAEVEAAAAWLNARTGPEDTLGGNANIAWLLKARTIPYMQMINWYGIPTQGYENGIARERFRFDASLENAKFAVIGDIDQRWTFGEPNVIQLAQRMEAGHWPIVWQGEFYQILANPRFLPAPEPQ